MIKIMDFKEKGLRITWTLLEIGFNNYSKYGDQFSAKDIIGYANETLEENIESIDAVLLASTFESNTEDIREILRRLSHNEKSSWDVELRKWRVIYVLKHLPDSSMDCIQGLIELGDIWATFNFPPDSPHVFQGRDNKITPQEYYTQGNYENLLKTHQNWVDEEINKINQYNI